MPWSWHRTQGANTRVVSTSTFSSVAVLCMCLSSTGTLASPNPHLILTLTLTLTLSFTGTLVSSSLRRTFQRLRVRFSVASDGGVRPNHGVQRLETTENHLRDERREREGTEKGRRRRDAEEGKGVKSELDGTS